MIAILSPAKNIDFTPIDLPQPLSRPMFVNHANELVAMLREFSPTYLAALYKVSNNLAELNFMRFAQWQALADDNALRPAGFAFHGEVYRGFDIRSLSSEQLEWGNRHICILSGLYGLLHLLDGIQAYRLEMGTRLDFGQYTTLYDLWRDTITQQIAFAIAGSSGDKVLVNLASIEYAKVVNRQSLGFPVLDIDFKQEHQGSLRNVTVYAKRARGLMARFMSMHQIEAIEDLKSFDLEGYMFSFHHSSEKKWVFIR